MTLDSRSVPGTFPYKTYEGTVAHIDERRGYVIVATKVQNGAGEVLGTMTDFEVVV